MTTMISPSVDHDIRLQALSPAHSFIVQAPAGSGKTELLAQRYLRLLALVPQPEQVLAITFTRKAASEMSNRILQALNRASESSRPEEPHRALTWDLAQAVLEKDRQLQWHLLSHPSRLRIQTMDALNASLARRLPILSGTGTVLEIATDVADIYESAAHALIGQLGDGSAVSHQLETVLLHVANRVPALIDMLVDLLQRRDQWLPLVSHHSISELRGKIEQTLCAAIAHHLQLLRASIPEMMHQELIELAKYAAGNRLGNNPKADVEPLLRTCAELEALPGSSHQDVMAWRGIATILCAQEGHFYSSLTKTQGFPTTNVEAKHRMEALLNVFKDISGLAELFNGVHLLPSAQYSDAQWQVLTALLTLLPQAVGWLKVEFQQRGQVDFVELALRAREALGAEDNPTDLALALDMRLQHILVDEFQDTSITQMQLLQMLTAGWTADDGRTLFCVGDPMQSIYRFRQAEVGLFLAVQQNRLFNVQMQSLKLQTNFRSTQPVVAWINQQFPYVLPAVSDSEMGAVSYSASMPRTDAPEMGGVIIHAAIDRSAEQEAKDVVTLIKDVLSNNERTRIAILVGGRSHVSAIASMLTRESIPFNAVDIEPLQDRPLIQDLMSLTRALLHLGDRTAWLACLRAPWCGLSLHDLHTIAAGSPDETIWTLLTDGQHTSLDQDSSLRVERFVAVIAAALNERGKYNLRDWIQRCWLALGGVAVLDQISDLHDAHAYFSRLEEIEVAGDLTDITDLDTQLQDLYASPANNPAARVEIMTIHKSKGLEFDIVILPSLHRTPQRDSTRLLRWTQLTGLPADGLVLSPPQARGEQNDAIYDWLKYLDQRRNELERGRLLYVAATRAKQELHLYGSVGIDAKGKIQAPRQGTLLELLWHVAEPVFEQRLQDRQPTSNTAKPSFANVPIRRLPIDWKMPPVAESLKAASTRPVVNADNELIEFDWVGETSRHVGTVVHAELEHMLSDVAVLQGWSPEGRRAILMTRLAEQGVPEALREQACERVMQSVRNTLEDTRGRWLLNMDDSLREADSELALSGVIEGRVVNCVIDRTFVDADGTRWIVDFKTSAHEGGDREGFLRSEELRYRPQLQRYATLVRAWKPGQPVRTALYFPLLCEWRELK